MVARQQAERLSRDFAPVAVIDAARRSAARPGDSAIGVGSTILRHSVPRQDRGGQQIALAEQPGEVGQLGIGAQIGALDIDMRDAAAPARR